MSKKKYVILLPDGAAGEPLSVLDGLTPLQAARIPHMDRVAGAGQLGRVQTVPDGYVPATDVGTLSLFGYAPDEHYSGRAPIEAAARGLHTEPDDLVYRCNLVTLEQGRMADNTGGHVSQEEADRLMADLDALFADEPCRFHASVSYRNLMVRSNVQALDLITQAPHDIPDELVADYQPKGDGAEEVISLMDRARVLLVDHPINVARRREGRAQISDIWLWGQGRPTRLPAFAERFGIRGAVITGVDIIRGLAVCMGMDLIDVPGATGYLDTDYAGKGRAAAAALDEYDLVSVHVEAPDEAGHARDGAAKVEALERIDEFVLAPILEALEGRDEWRLLIAPDHPTPASHGRHCSKPPPYAFCGTDVVEASGLPFDERSASRGPLIDPGHLLIGRFMGRPGCRE
jgi:2,3-bisphosphoglycerate-independent phosphoglycerate mutase